MKVYLVSLAAGVLVGAIYSVLGVRSPAPPVVALLGLLGMLLGEQGVVIVRRALSGQPVTASWVSQKCAPPILGTPASAPAPAEKDEASMEGRPRT